MTLENKGTYENKLTIYVPAEKKRLVIRARQLFKREGSSLSKWVLEQLEAYVRLHEPGNPQQTIIRFAKEKNPYIAPKKCQFPKCNKPAITIVVHKKTGKQYAVCRFHKAACLESGKWEEVES